MICSQETMKDALVLLVLLSVRTTKVCSLPYVADSDGNCHNSTAEYLSDELKLCCKRCKPGQRLVQGCTETTESVCEDCSSGQYMEGWNYNTNCFSCNRCKPSKGLRYAQTCSPTTRARCACMPGMYCIVGFEKPYCTGCLKYRQCKPGYGVSAPGTADSDVKCERCPDGMFSDSLSDTDPCRPHTDCDGRAVLRKGNATSNTVCEHGGAGPAWLQNTTRERDTAIVFTTASTTRSTVLAISDSTLPVRLSASQDVFNHSTESPPPLTGPDVNMAVTIATVTGVIVLVIMICIVTVCLCKPHRRPESEDFCPKVDANGNCESGDKINPGYLGEAPLTSFTVLSPEQQCLLERGDVCSDHSQFNNNTETSTRMEGCSNYDSIGPLQSTVALDNSSSTLSEPMILISNTEPVTPQPSLPSPPPPQPTVTTSPHVNVSITFHIGNGSCGTPSVMPTNLKEAVEDCELQYGEEEESFSIPQQEDGKQSIMSVQDSASDSI